MQTPFFDRQVVDDETLERFLGIADNRPAALPEQDPTIAHLASRLRVEGGAVEHRLPIGPFLKVRHLSTGVEQSEHGPFELQTVVAVERGHQASLGETLVLGP